MIESRDGLYFQTVNDQQHRMGLTEPEQFRALGHPVRWRIVGVLGETTDATVTQLAGQLGLTKGAVGHHVNVLAAAGLIVRSRQRQVGGATEKYWRRAAGSFDLHGPAKPTLRATTLRAVADEIESATTEPSHLIVRRVRISADAAGELAQALDAVSDRVDQLAAAATDPAVDTGVVLAVYHLATADATGGPDSASSTSRQPGEGDRP
jgi:predicted ArsR family transcriptional regulator